MINLDLGVKVMTQGVNALCGGHTDLLRQFAKRYKEADWGDLCNDEKKENNAALEFGGRIFAKYYFNGEYICIITEADRSVTTVLLLREYEQMKYYPVCHAVEGTLPY